MTIEDPLTALSELLGDLQRGHVAQVFCASTLVMLADLDHAAALGDWVIVRVLADRIRAGCLVVRELDAAACVTCLCEEHDRDLMKWLYVNVYSRDRAKITQLVKAMEAAFGPEQVTWKPRE
jgi:hypothetical protein